MDGYELIVLKEAERWAREVMRNDKDLLLFEKNLFKAVTSYVMSIRKPKIPPLPPLPKIDYKTPITRRYSQIPTKPTPPGLTIEDINVDDLWKDNDD